jgi:hypothetical protein
LSKFFAVRKVRVPKKLLAYLDQLILDFIDLPSIEKTRRIMYCMYNVTYYDDDTIKIDPYLLPMFRKLKSMYPTVRDEDLVKTLLGAKPSKKNFIGGGGHGEAKGCGYL